MKSITKLYIVEMFYRTPDSKSTGSTFRDETMNVWIPLKITSKSMKNADESRNKVLCFINLGKHTKNYTLDSMKKTVKKRTVFQKEGSKLFRNSKNTMTMFTVNNLKGHGGSAINRIHVSAGRTKTAFAAEGNKLKLTAFRAAEHGTSEGGITTVNHLFDIFENR